LVTITATELAHRLISGEESVLGGVAGRLLIAKDAIGGIIDRALIEAHQLIERLRVALAGRSDESRFLHPLHLTSGNS